MRRRLSHEPPRWKPGRQCTPRQRYAAAAAAAADATTGKAGAAAAATVALGEANAAAAAAVGAADAVGASAAAAAATPAHYMDCASFAVSDVRRASPGGRQALSSRTWNRQEVKIRTVPQI